MEEQYKFQGDNEEAVNNLLSSEILKTDENLEGAEGGADNQGVEQLKKISKNNIKKIEDEIQKINDDLDKYQRGDQTGIQDTLNEIKKILTQKYKNPIVAHASKNRIIGQINSTTNRKKLSEFKQKVTQEQNSDSRKEYSNTGEMNEAQFKSHDFVFLNIYPESSEKKDMRDVLSKSRFLRENYAQSESPYARDASTYVYDLDQVLKETGQVVAVLRDPVYPSGGKTTEERQKRIGMSPHRFVGSSREGEYKYAIGKTDSKDNTYIYQTRQNIFEGEDINNALSKNVLRGIYRILLVEQKQETNEFLMRLEKITQYQDKETQYQEIEKLTKMFQYPQLMVSGALTTKIAKEYLWQDEKPELYGAVAATMETNKENEKLKGEVTVQGGCNNQKNTPDRSNNEVKLINCNH
ncbi:MAG: hypothetical protein F6K26_30050 [Moorea sp. SIO2I5]|nr:hypothetical protein [Moorena sp. SIO2I5]